MMYMVNSDINMAKRKTIKSRKKPIFLASALAVLILAIGIAILLRHHNTADTSDEAKTTSTAQTAQSDFKNGGKKLGSKAPEPSPTNAGTDNAGATTQNTTDSSAWSK
jgi:hypothetical protein